MQTRTYGDLFKLIQSMAGVTAFASTEQDDIANLINRRYSQAYNTSQQWPRYLVPSEERPIASIEFKNYQNQSPADTLFVKIGTSDTALSRDEGADVFVSTSSKTSSFSRNGGRWFFWAGSEYTVNPITNVVTYTADDGVHYFHQNTTDTAIYSSPAEVKEWGHSGAGIGSANDPANIEVNGCAKITYDSFMFPILDSSKDTGTLTTISEFIRIHRNRAFQRSSSIEYDFYVDEDGASILNITNTEDVKGFVTYKKIFVPFTTSSDFTTSTEAVPSEFFQYLAHATYSDFLRMDGQHEKAQLEQGNAEGFLAAELERIDVIMNNNTINKRFTTYVNRQSR